MKKFLVGFLFLSVFLIFVQAANYGEVPHLLRYQGTLIDSNNVSLYGSYDLKFCIYDAAAGGNLLWAETQTAVSVSDGIFSVLLGNITALDLPFDKDYWLSTEVGTSGEMFPRQRITSVGYAIRAETAEKLANPPAPPQIAQAAGATDNPTTVSYEYSDLAEMTITMTTGANPVFILFNGTFKESSGESNLSIIINIDGVDKVESRRGFLDVSVNEWNHLSSSWLGMMGAGTHTFKVRWKVDFGTATACAKERTLQVIELK